jgi:prophage endopeptidase
MSLLAWLKRFVIDSAIPLLFAYAAWTAQGWRKDLVTAELQQETAENEKEAALHLVTAMTKVRELEREIEVGFDDRTQQLKKEIQNARHDRDHFIAGVRNGTIRLSIPITTLAGCAATADTGIAARGGDEARAELDPTAASTLEAITNDGDDRIRQLNMCIDDYNAVREKYNVQAD